MVKKKNKVRPLKIIFNDSNSAKLALRSNANNNDFRSHFKADLTDSQRDSIKWIKAELENRKSNGEENLIIRYINNTPTICQRSNINSTSTDSLHNVNASKN